MEYEKIARDLEGYQTVQTVENRLNVNRARAIYLLYKLKKMGFVKTKYSSDKKRVYDISPMNAVGGTSYLEIINKHSPIKLAESEVHRIHGRKVTIEEVIIYAIKQKNVRFTIACLSLYKKIKNWSELYRMAKKEEKVREVAALYDIARLFIPKIPRMPKRFKNLALKLVKNGKYKHIVEDIESRDFIELERKWKIYIPLNLGDLEDYKYD
jgi:hypothetical protein